MSSITLYQLPEPVRLDPRFDPYHAFQAFTLRGALAGLSYSHTDSGIFLF